MGEFSPYPARNIKEVLEISLEGSGKTWFVFVVCVWCVCVSLVVLCGVSGIIIFEEMEKKKCFGCRIMFCQKFSLSSQVQKV